MLAFSLFALHNVFPLINDPNPCPLKVVNILSQERILGHMDLPYWYDINCLTCGTCSMLVAYQKLHFTCLCFTYNQLSKMQVLKIRSFATLFVTFSLNFKKAQLQNYIWGKPWEKRKPLGKSLFILFVHGTN